MRKALPKGLQRQARRLLGFGLVLTLGLPGIAGAGAAKPEPEPSKIAPSESGGAQLDTPTDDASRTTLKSLTTLAGLQFFPEKESEGLVLHGFSDSDESTSNLTRRRSKLKLFRYDRRMQFRDSEVLLKVRTPGKRKSLISLELKF
jgi:hypothetical protein